jgi:hypothetical protein
MLLSVPRMETTLKILLKKEALIGIKQGWHSFVWMVKIIIPVSLFGAILQWSGWLGNVNQYFQPAMNFFNLPPEAVFPIVSGILINIYAVIAILTTVSFSLGQMTLIAIFALVAHNMIIEGIIQHRSGTNFVKASLLRIVTAIVLVFIVSRFFGDAVQSIDMTAAATTQPFFLTMLRSWSVDTVVLLTKIFGIIMFIMILLQISKSMGWIEKVNRFIRALTRVLGFSSSLSTGYVAGIIFGLMYGAAVIIEEAKKENIDRQELKYLQASLGINHSLIEDPILFALLGINLLWLWIPRFIVAVAVVQGYRLIHRLTCKSETN